MDDLAARLAKKIAETIDGWREDMLHASYDSDGGGYFDFGGFTTRPEGVAALEEVIREFLRDEATANPSE